MTATSEPEESKAADESMPAGDPSSAGESKPARPSGPEGTSSLDLVAPPPVPVVAPEEAERRVAIAPEAADRIERLVTSFVETISSMDVHSEDYRRGVADINGIGEREIVATSEMSNRLLDRPVRAISGVLEGKSPVAKNLVELRHAVEDLNPAGHDLTQGGPRKLFGVIPFGDRLRSYFDRYSKAQGHIQGIVRALSEGRTELERDNAAISQEERSLWTEMETLRQYAYMAQRLDEALERRIDAIATSDAGRAKALREDVLFPVRHRRQDILTQLAVATQGYAALRVVEKNNQEVIRAIQTATTTTVAALRTAVMVAQALTNQRLVVDQLKAVHEVTSGMIEGTSTLLREQSAEVETQATSSGVDIDALQRAWDNVFAALDQIDEYKLNALAAMKVTVNQLTGQVERSREYVDRLQRQEGDTIPKLTRDEGSKLRLS